MTNDDAKAKMKAKFRHERPQIIWCEECQEDTVHLVKYEEDKLITKCENHLKTEPIQVEVIGYCITCYGPVYKPENKGGVICLDCGFWTWCYYSTKTRMT